MLKVQTAKLEDQLKALKLEITKKLETMVEVFSYKITHEAINNTPMGNYNRVTAQWYDNPDRLKYAKNNRPGSAKGGWRLDINKQSTSWWFMQATDDGADNVKWANKMRAQDYKLGDRVIITNNVPYVANDGWFLPDFDSLENNYSKQTGGQGIIKPTIAAIQGVYKLELDKYYRGEIS